jgi:putative DNA primase/helicase
MTAADVATALGNFRPEGGEWRCECPLCHRITLTLRDGEKRMLVKCWNGCASKEIVAELARRDLKITNGVAGQPETRTEFEARTNAAAAKRQARVDSALDTWNNSFAATDTIVETYLWSRLLMQPVSPALRYAPALWYREAGAKRPAMIGLVEHADKGAVGIHATFLNPLDPTVRVTIKPRKKSFGPVKGGAVRLAPAGETLAIAEGIEDALTFIQETGTPAWAAISWAGIRDLIPPPAASTPNLIFIEDKDTVGQHAVADAARKFSQQGYSITIVRATEGKDINAALLALGPGENLFTRSNYEPEKTGDWYSMCLAGSDGRTLSNLSNTLLALGHDPAWHDAFIRDGISDTGLLTRPLPPRAHSKDD